MDKKMDGVERFGWVEGCRARRRFGGWMEDGRDGKDKWRKGSVGLSDGWKVRG